MNDFLPADYKVPSESSYMSLEDGKNKFRFLSKPVFGMGYWKTVGEDRIPVRKRMGEAINVKELELNKWGKVDQPKHFWAMVVYNHNEGKIQILEINKKTVISAIKALIEDSDWGDPRNYDIVITRSGKDLQTEYSVMPTPAKPLATEILEEYKSMSINLEALFDGQDPFNSQPVMDETINSDDLPF